MSKYHAVPTVVHGWRFDSKREAKRYQELLLLGRAGVIRNLELQPTFPLWGYRVDEAGISYRCVGTYRADFRYEEHVDRTPSTVGWRDVVEDVKGVRTAVYRLKKRMMDAQYGIQIRET